MLYLATLLAFVFAMLAMALGIACGKPPLAARCKPGGVCARNGGACEHADRCALRRRVSENEP